MRISTTCRILLMVVLALVLGSCGNCNPPSISQFSAATANVCPRGLVGLGWTADADEVALEADRDTGERLPTGLPVVATGSGFNFRVAATDTTFTLIARRAGQTVRSNPVTVHVINPNPLALGLELTYDCADHRWEHPGFNFSEYDRILTIESITNNETREALLIDISGDIPPGETRPVTPPRSLPGSPINAYPSSGNRPVCTGTGGGVGSGGTDTQPPPVHITLNLRCP